MRIRTTCPSTMTASASCICRGFTTSRRFQRHVECLKLEIKYYEAVLNGDERGAQKAREMLFNSMGNDGDEDE